MNTPRPLLALLFLVALEYNVRAQDAVPDSTRVVAIEKNDRSTVVGRIISSDAREVVVTTKDGKLFIPKHEIRAIIQQGERPKDSRFQAAQGEQAFGSYYGFTQGALPHEADQGHLQLSIVSTDFELYLNENLSVGLMSSIIAAPIIARANYSFSMGRNVYGSVGGFVGWGGSIAEDNGTAMPIFSLTTGNSINNFTVGVGYGYSTFMEDVYRFDGEFRRTDPYTGNTIIDTLMTFTPVRLNTGRAWVSLGGVVEVSSSISFVLDAFYISDAGMAKLPTDNVYLKYDENYSWQRTRATEIETFSTIIISPSIRWKYGPRGSLQFGFTGYKGNFLNQEDNSGWSSFPIPMVQWFMKL